MRATALGSGGVAASTTSASVLATEGRNLLSRVLPDGPGGYLSLHWRSPKSGQPDQNGTPVPFFWNDRAFSDVHTLIDFAGWLVRQPPIADLYYCTARLRDHGGVPKSGRGLRAKRLKSNVLSRKCFCADIDIKPAGYVTLQEAQAALAGAVLATGLPSPEVYVGSGGGLHCYWLLDEPISLEKWQPYADGVADALLKAGLRFDSQCTVDPVRILRVPGTYNCKFNPPAQVRVL